MVIRRYVENDLDEVVDLFIGTITSINKVDYTLKQLDAWISGLKDKDKLNQRFLASYSLVAEEDDKIIGFGNILKDGYLDMLYVHFDFIGQGVGSKILEGLEKAFEFKKITTHSSITAKEFFISHGFREVKKQEVVRNGIILTNYVLESKGEL